MVLIPMGRVLPLSFGMCTRRMGWWRYLFSTIRPSKFQIPLQVLPVLLLRDSIHSHRRVLADTAEGAGEQLLIHEMGQRMKLRFGLSFRSFRYPLESRSHGGRRRSIGHVSPQRFTPARARFARPG